ncbi:MAG: sulfotransferase family 2 domain-containing protein [Methylococcaceae bacterium]
MLISPSHQFIFFHIGKTAGMSMRGVLEKYEQEPDKFKIPRPPQYTDQGPNRFYDVWRTLLLHAKAREARKELPQEMFERYFKFAFVRNPWDWQVSVYHFILKEPTSSTHEAVKACGSFPKYLEWARHHPAPYPKGITKLQSEMITDEDGTLLVDFLGHYESLEADFDVIREKLGIEERLPHINKSQHTHYREYYDDHTRNLVAEQCKTDIELFGYEF